MRAWIWDLDGTLLDSYAVIVAAALAAAKEAGIQDHESSVLRTVKRGSLSVYLRDVSARSGVPFERLLERYRGVTHGLDGRITLISGAESTLRGLLAAGDTHYVYTHRGESSHTLLKRLGIADCFREVVTSTAGFRPKPSGDGVRFLADRYALDPEQTFYVGDRPLDVLCAKDAGVRSVLFLPPDSPVLPTGQEDRIIRSLDELLTAFDHPKGENP